MDGTIVLIISHQILKMMHETNMGADHIDCIAPAPRSKLDTVITGKWCGCGELLVINLTDLRVMYLEATANRTTNGPDLECHNPKLK